MRLLKNRAAAKVITAAVIILSILLGGSMSLERVRDESWAYYYHSNGKDDGLGIFYDLEQIAANTNNLLTVAGRNLPSDDARAADVRQSLLALVSAEGPAEKSRALSVLTEELNELSYALETAELSSRDDRYRVQCITNIQSHTMTIAASPYNTHARRFNTERSRIPANILASAFSIKPLELFE